MNPRDIPEIREAEAELRKAEASFPSRESAEMFKDAFESLDDFTDLSKPSAEVAQFIDNLKLSYTRTIVKHLSQIDTKDFDHYIYYTFIVFVRMRATIGKLSAMDPDTSRMLAECKVRFRPQIEELVCELQSSSI